MKIKDLNISNTNVKLGNLNIIVGPNGAGKTTLLSDLRVEFVTGAPQSGKWLNLLTDGSIEISSADWKAWSDALAPISGTNEGYNGISYRLCADIRSIGRQQKPSMLREDFANELKEFISQDQLPPPVIQGQYPPRDFVTPMKDQWSTLLSVDTRLSLSQNTVSQYNADTMNSIQPASFLAVNDKILNSINDKLTKMFKKKIFIESRNINSLEIYTTSSYVKAPKYPDAKPQNYKKITEIVDKWINDNNVILLSQEGHGVRAAAQILYELESESNKIVFIDEPELHLYPAAKYLLGGFIGMYAKRGQKQIIVSTHDSDLLRGLIDSNSNATIIRISKDRSVHHIKSSEIQKTTTNEFLQSAFSDVIIITEGVQDQFVYNKAFRLKKRLEDYSYQILAANGKENVSNELYLFEKLNIKYAVIVDFDALYDEHKRRRSNKVNSIQEIITGRIPQNDIAQNIINKVKAINNTTYGKPSRKRGLNADDISDNDKENIQELLTSLESYGIFVVPIGELEDWVNTTKEESTPEDIVKKYRSRSESSYKLLTEFTKRIENYIQDN